jgi:hypothetical protein
MYNLLIALAIASAFFALGMIVAGTLVAGFVPGILALIVAYFILARRSGRAFQTIAERAAVEFQQGRFEPGLKLMESALVMSRWQFGIAGQVHGQIGMLMYMQRKWSDARKHLDKSWKRDWRARTMLAAIDHREGQKDSALDRMAALTSHGGKDPVFWALYAYIAVEAKKCDVALEVLTEGLKKCKDSPGLKDLKQAVANKKKLKMKPFAPTWFQYFPEQMPRSMMTQYAQQQGGMRYPQPRR